MCSRDNRCYAQISCQTCPPAVDNITAAAAARMFVLSVDYPFSGTPPLFICRPLCRRETKAEMLSLQPASPSTVGAVAVAPSETAAAAATVESRGESLRSSPFSFKAGERSTTPAWLVKLGMPPMPVTESSVGDKTKTKTSLTAAQTQQGTACSCPILEEALFASCVL